VRSLLSFQSKRELLLQIAPRYREASSPLKTVILDEFVAATGYARKYAIRLLSQPVSAKLKIERPRPRQVQQALHLAWTAANHICAKRLIPFLPTLVESLERHGHLQLSEECRVQLLAMSPATADRILGPARKQERRGISTTRSGTLLKKQIPVRTFQDWNEAKPGFMEADLVAHCGTSAEGSFLYTLTLTDIATGWTECLPLLNRNQEAVVAALKRARQLLPFPRLRIDTDNGVEFINVELLSYCEDEQITFTRGRPHKSNDQCYVEQKNGNVVRQVVGYDRFTGEPAYRQLAELYRGLRVYVNCFQPSMKLQTKEREGSKVRRTYDDAQTPMQRLLASPVLPPKKQQELLRVTEAMDPLRLLRQLEHLQKALWRHAVPPEITSANQIPASTLRFSVEGVSQEKLPTDGLPHTPPSLLKQERKRRYQKSGRPHDWRTRQDPFEGVWEEVTGWLQQRPELTAAEIFRELQSRYPDRWRPTQARTLRRGVQKVRARLLVTFDDGWGEEVLGGHAAVPELHAEMVGGVG
jgi:hypothetical protein